jgi:hypothetical protein
MTATPITFDHWPLEPINSRVKRARSREILRRWRAKQRALGMCAYCWRRQAGSDGGTAAICGYCRRQRKADRGRTRQRRRLEMQAHELSGGPGQPASLISGSEERTASKESAIAQDRSLAFKKKPPMHEGSDKIERMLQLSALAAKQRASSH